MENQQQVGIFEKVIGIIVVSTISLVLALGMAGYVIVHYMIPYEMDHNQQTTTSK